MDNTDIVLAVIFSGLIGYVIGEIPGLILLGLLGLLGSSLLFIFREVTTEDNKGENKTVSNDVNKLSLIEIFEVAPLTSKIVFLFGVIAAIVNVYYNGRTSNYTYTFFIAFCSYGIAYWTYNMMKETVSDQMCSKKLRKTKK